MSWINLESLIKETKVYTYKSSGPGGQHKNKRETAIRLVHIPTGLKVVATEFRSQSQNKELAFHRLKKRLLELTKRKKIRRRTVIPIGIKERILKEKKIHSEIKSLRKKIEYREDE
jgi:protein subunit release factor A